MQPGMMQDVEDAINAMDSVLEEILEEMDSGLQDADSGIDLDEMDLITSLLPDKIDISQQLLQDIDIVTEWLNDMLDSQLESDTLTESLADGVTLCLLTRALSKAARLAGVAKPPPLGVRRFHRNCRPESIQARDNVSSFGVWCMLYEVPPVLILGADDVVMGRNTTAIISLLLFLVRRSVDFTPATFSRKNSASSTGSYCERARRKSFTRNKSLESCFSDAMLQRKTGLFRTRSQSIDSEGSLCSSTSSARSPSNETSEAETLIRDLNLACRNISKKIVVANIEIPGYNSYSEPLCIDRTLESDNQSTLRRKSRIFRKAATVASMSTAPPVTNGYSTLNGRKRFILKSNVRKPDDVDISTEPLKLEDTEYLLLSNADNIANRIKSLYKLVALRALENQSRSTVKRVSGDCSLDPRIHPPCSLSIHSSQEKNTAFRTLKTFLIGRVSDNKDINFGEILESWNKRYDYLP